MASRVKMEGSDALAAKFRAMAADPARRDVEGLVGYSAPYAAAVHEDREAVHPRGGQAKYLSDPARLHQREISQSIRDDVAQGLPLRSAVLNAMRKLLEASRPLVPVDTGRLRDSGFAVTKYI